MSREIQTAWEKIYRLIGWDSLSQEDALALALVKVLEKLENEPRVVNNYYQDRPIELDFPAPPKREAIHFHRTIEDIGDD